MFRQAMLTSTALSTTALHLRMRLERWWRIERSIWMASEAHNRMVTSTTRLIEAQECLTDASRKLLEVVEKEA